MTKFRWLILLAPVLLLGLMSPASAAPASKTADTAFAYTGTWSAKDTTGRQSWSAGSTATMAVNVDAGGGTLSVYGSVGPGLGRASVSVDGGTAVNVDTYRSTWGDTNWFTSATLPQGCHTVKVTVLGQKNTASTGNTIVIREGRTSNGTILTAGSACTAPGAWLSGSTDEAGDPFSSWRGDEQDSATTWSDSQSACENQWQLGMGFANWNKPLVVVIGGKWEQSWSTAATGGMDSVWRTCLEKMKANLGSRPQSMLTISLFHESNGDWYPWEVSQADLPNFKAAWARFRALQESILPDARLMLALNADHVPPGGGYTPEQMFPPASQLDVLGLDMYSMHHPHGAGEGISDWVARAAALGKPLIIQEWGVKEDDTAFVQYVRDELVKHGGTGPGKIEMENYFNLWPETYQLEPTTTSPNAAALYRQLW
ncbi:hypothetical protein [Actinosynnema sp. ALI-1.44]|uniref:hypothetical protein n=1 Tax=Actinosynnema sp. ALI-1.44 TaxID=1933779 RepID=UPI0011773D4B|nr:hypothetical protein [Actinosynnema sp. ALI-1.44]